MTPLDRFIQRLRIRKLRPYLPPGTRVLDIGCANAALFEQIPELPDSVGIDPDLPRTMSGGGALLIRGEFPRDLPDRRLFDAVTLLAVLEHIPPDRHAELARNCHAFLRPTGLLLITVPSPRADYVLATLRFLRLIEGMALEQHFGFDPRRTPEIFCPAGFRLLEHRQFQLGFNSLFVFRKY